jgi:nicotinamidase-related amidase
MDVLIVVDMQNDFVTGTLGSKHAQNIVLPLKEYLNSLSEDTYVILTRDTHDESYMESNEGLHLPILHCQFNTWGWQIVDELKDCKHNRIINKPNFGIGSGTWRNILKDIDVTTITLVGLCTDICVISNALSLKIAYPEIPVRVIEKLCMGVTKESHEKAIATMKMCQVDII